MPAFDVEVQAMIATTAKVEPEPNPRTPGTVVIETENCEVLLTDLGFYSRCTKCPWVSENTHAKYVARQWAIDHDNDK